MSAAALASDNVVTLADTRRRLNLPQLCSNGVVTLLHTPDGFGSVLRLW